MLKVIEVPKFQSPFLNEFRFTDPFQMHKPLQLNEVERFILFGETIEMCERYYPEDYPEENVVKEACA